jgi:Glycosyl hydrolase family 99
MGSQMKPAVLSAHRRSSRVHAFVLAALAVALFLLAGAAPAHPAEPSTRAGDPPLFAYYYIWFNPTSWNRAKTDYPLLGRYSSDEREVMRQHIRWAKQTGIDGFIVSWKSTETLDRRLRKLVDVAEDEKFNLAIIYQGLDFARDPLPVERVANDMDFFTSHFAKRKPFRALKKPVVIWSGTWRFSREEIALVTESRRDRLLILASERDLEGWERVGDLVDGNGYYWSSVNPDTFPDYEERLAAMGAAVHAKHGLWFAPAAPGFDALLVGGTTIVERKGGDTLRREYNAALSSSPDAIGLISWNEFSENSHIEPSEKFGARYLEVLADIRGAKPPKVQSFDSSEPASTARSYGPPVIGAALIIILAAVFVGVRRRRVPTPRPLSGSFPSRSR